MIHLARHGVLAVGVATLAAHMACGRDAGPAILLDEGVSWALAEWRARTLSDIHYTYHLRVPRALEMPLEGTLVAQFQWLDAGANDLVLDFKDPAVRIRGVRVNGAAVEWEARHDHVVVPAAALTSGDRNRVDVEFQAGDEALNRNEDFLYTLFVPDRAHFSLPLFDQPNLKARFSLTLEVPDGWVAVANGGVTEETAVPAAHGGGTTYHFAETEPIPTYLFAFAVGNFQIDVAERAGRTLRMFHRETDADKVARNREAIFDLHAVALEWLEDYTQIAYPFGKFDFVLIPPFQYGGMEHPGSIFYRQSSLLLDASATQAHYLGRASLIAHETTHMWFGDLVTMSWFDDVWTKEVFANFMAAKIVHPSFPDVNHDLRFFLAHHNTAYAVDRSAGANPIRQPLENLKAAGSLYGPIIYQKAPIVMRQLESLVGEDLFRDGLREYLHTFRYGNATWPDLIDILDRRADAGLAAWSAAWVDEPGRPVVTTERLDDTDRADRLRVSQDDPHDQGRLWPQQLELLLSYDDRDVRMPLSLSGASAALGWEGRARPNFVLPNASGIEYGHFRLDSGSVDYLMSYLPDLEDSLTRGIVWVTLWDGVLEGEIAPSDWFELLLRGLATETVEQNTERILEYLGTTFWAFLDDDRRRENAPRVESALWLALADAATPTLRAAYFRAWRRIVLSDAGLERMRRIWEEREDVPGVPLSEPDFTALAEGLAVRGVAGAEDILEHQAERIENPDRLARFTFVRPAVSADPGVRERFFEGLRDPANREREPWVLAAVGYLHHPLRAAHARRFVRPSLELVEEIQRTGDIFFPSGWLDATLVGHNSAEVADTVRRFLDGLGADYPRRLREKVLQSADMLFRSARISGQ